MAIQIVKTIFTTLKGSGEERFQSNMMHLLYFKKSDF